MMGEYWSIILAVQILWRCTATQAEHTSATLHFTQALYNVTIHENSAAKTYAEAPSKMGVQLRNPTWDIRYKIESGDSEHIFKADEFFLGDFSFLRIRTKGGSLSTLNREVKDRYDLTVVAQERLSHAEARAGVIVHVLDVNDLRPLFSPISYSFSVPENTAPRTSVGKVTATDADVGTNGQFYYSFKQWTDMFAVHPTSGVVTLTGKLDYGEARLYELDVLAEDRGLRLSGGGSSSRIGSEHGGRSGSSSNVARLTVQVLPANEHAPVITAVPATLWKSTKKEETTTFAVVTVEDSDPGPNGEIAALSIVAGDPLQQFKVVRTMSQAGEKFKIQAVREVEWEGHQYGYNLTLQAQDRGNPPRYSAAQVVRLQPLQHHTAPPEFEKAVYMARLSECAPPNTSVITVRAQHKSPLISYLLQPRSNQQLGPFTVNPNTGLITTTQAVQADRVSKYEFNVITSDKQASTKVSVEVVDENNHTPKFTRPVYTARVNENVPLGTSVLTVSASDPDEGENGYVTYTITNVNPHPFHIDYFTGVITTAESLDYELMQHTFRLKVRASDWGAPFRREAEATVSITLNNLNDNAPLFENIDCQLTVPRSFRADETIAVVSAIDMDDLGVVRYEIKAGNSMGLFGLDPESGILSLEKPLNSGSAAKITSHTLEIVASDGENSSPPVILNITVVTGGRQVTTKCVETGVAKDMASRLLLFGLSRRQKDSDEESFTDAYLVNQHSPQLIEMPNGLEVKENVPVGLEVLHIKATDTDSGFNGKLVYVISRGNIDSCFSIDPDTGKLIISEPLDRETTDQYDLNITVYDLGSPQKSMSHVLKIKILDANDNKPQFQHREYSVHISEDTAVGTDIIQLQATDRDLDMNGEVRYSFMTQTNQFHINSKTGIVTVRSPLDRELHESFALKVAVHDKAVDEPELISTAVLKVTLEDINDNPPVFSHPLYHVRVPEDLPAGSVVAWLEAYDPDAGLAGQVRYTLMDDLDNGLFQVDRVSGAVRIARSLDFEKRQVYNMSVQARDKGRPVSLTATCHVMVEVVDVNENLHRPAFPFFTHSAHVSENVPIGATVLKVKAVDKDMGRDGEVRYSIRDGSGVGVFAVNEETGVIYTEEKLDRETTGQYWLTVYATDQGVVPQSSSVEVYIEVKDVNDNAPQTSEPIYFQSIYENSPKDTSVIQIEARDPDSGGRNDKLSFRITSGNPQGFFIIDPKTGLLTTTSRKLDREKQEEHSLEITVTDSGTPAKSVAVRVIVNVLDINDNTPQFLEKVYKIQLPARARTADGQPVYRVIASDQDAAGSPNAEVTYSIEDGDRHGKFVIDPRTGMVSSRESFAAGEYNILMIKAADNGRPQRSSTCRLHVEWIPRPSIAAHSSLELEAAPQASFTVMESDRVGHMVGVIRTQPTDSPVWFVIKGDLDAKDAFHIIQRASDPNGTAEGGNSNNNFDVNKGSGTIIVAGSLDAEQKSNYNLTVEVTDGTRSITTQVLIEVIDTNEHRPEFSHSAYAISIPEETPSGTKILEILATDNDVKNKLYYTLLSSTDPLSLHKFRLDPGSGFLYTAETLDHEVMNRHTLTVMVRDHELPLKRNLVRVTVTVEDNNDNAPYFTSPRYSARVLETSALGSVVTQVTALDKDKGKNAELLYSIHSGNEASTFAIDMSSGMITVAEELDCCTEIDEFTLIIKATDKGEPPLSAETTVHISVTVADNGKPKFTSSEMSAEVSEGAAVGSLVALVEASSQSSVFYQIKEGNNDSAFVINPHSGAIVTLKPLDYEMASSYRLVVDGTDMTGFASNVTVLIYIKDENDNPPVFSKDEFFGTISESAAINSLVLMDINSPLVIHATDADTDLNGRVLYEIVEPDARKYFLLDSSTGAVQTKSNLDYEQRTAFQFSVQAHDMGAPRRFASNAARVTIQVVDVNDCEPKFSQDLYDATLLLPAYKGVRIMAVNATDEDSQARLLFSISDGNIGEKFKIDSLSGVISVQNATQLRSRYKLTVRVSDGRWQSTATVRVSVKEIKDGSSVRFTQKIYTAVVLENSSQRKTIAIISVVGRKINDHLFYAILNDEDGRFEIGQTSGVLFTTGLPFDREEQEVHEVVVGVTAEPGSSKVIGNVLVRVKVEDINDCPPTFVNMPYHILVQINAEVGQVIRQMTAVDKDVGRNAEVKYVLNEHKYFQMSSSGEISLRRPFDSEALNTKFVLSVVAEDLGEPALSSTVEVSVMVLNEAAPVFEKPFYNIEIPENTPPHTSIMQVQVNDLYSPRAFYSIFEGDPLGHFSINFHSGVIEIVQDLDFEVHPAYKLRVRGMDAMTGAHSEVFIDIILLDVNDNSPVFETHAYNVTLPESAVIGTPILQVKASDADFGSNKVLAYELLQPVGPSDLSLFSINRETGTVSISSPLDHETKQQHTLRVRAVDGGIPALSGEASVIITLADVNDNPPAFTKESYEAAVSELSSPGHFLLNVRADDPDASDTGKLEYFFLSGNERAHFTLNKKTGDVLVSNHYRSGMEPSYSMNVLVTDGVFRSSAEVKIRVIQENSHSPSFAQREYLVQLPEDSPAGTLVTEVKVTDKDRGVHGQVKYFIANEVVRDKFTIDADGQIYTLESFDRENTLEKELDINVMAKDGGGKVGFCTVRVIITDVNDNAPQFVVSEYNVSVPQNISTGFSIMKITAVDLDEGVNADILYEIDSEVQHFEIHPQTGVISSKQHLLESENNLFTLYVKARDSGTPQKHTFIPVHITVVPSAVSELEFVKPTIQLQISEDLPVGAEVDTIDVYSSDQFVTYNLLRGNLPESNREDAFAIDSISGVLRVAKRLDYESTPWYHLTVQAIKYQAGTEMKSMMEVKIELMDVNDNSPQFDSDPYQSYVVENSPKQTSIIQVRAVDQDTALNGQVLYSLDKNQESPEVLDLFTVDATTGWLTTLKEIDREQNGKYTISVVASDRGKEQRLAATTLVEVTVLDVNDNAPRFAEEVFKAVVNEDDPVSTVVALFDITDGDSEEINREISCYISGGDTAGHFDVGRSQGRVGEWRLTVRKPLDRERKDNYLLNLTATDGTHLARAAVEIKVLDANDNSPVCEKLAYAGTVAEDAPAGLLIVQVSATDADLHANAQISYHLFGDGSQHFSLHPTTGELRTLLPLDREDQETFRLSVRAQDGGGLSCQVALVITVADVNDNPPRFTPDAQHFSVAENTAPSAYVAQMKALDPDSGMNAKVLYTLEDSGGGQFSVQEHSGILTLEKPLDASVCTAYTFKVRATDQGSPRPLSSLNTVTATVRTAADNPPEFQLRDYVVTVAEDVSPGTQILRIFASRGGGGGARDARDEISYSITGGNEQGAFSINSHTGDIFVIKQLDYEASHEHFLTVEAMTAAAAGGKEPSSRLSNMASVRVNVTDVNDNRPVFSQGGVYSAVVREDAAPGTTVATMMASDADGPANNRVHFAIVSGNQGSPFIIDAISGELRVARALDREQVPEYVLTVLASDSGSPSKSSSAMVTIDVLDINDNPPLFTRTNYSLVIQESVPLGSSILQLQATDRDAPHNGAPFTFSILRGDEKGAFRMDPQGTLSTRTQLSHRVQENYLLRVKVSDSGKPPLSSFTVVSVRVVERSKHAPVVHPLEVIVSTPRDEYSGGLLGTIHATDADPYDTLSYSLPPSARPLFSVSPTDGRLLAPKGLDAGFYPLNVSVSDGRFTSSGAVNVHIRRVTRKMLEQAIAVRISPATPEEFLTTHVRNVQRAVRSAAGARRGDVHLISLQPVGPNAGPNHSLDLLLSVERSPAGARSDHQGSLLDKINASLTGLKQAGGLRQAHVLRGPCVAIRDHCPPAFCKEVALLEQNSMVTHSSARMSFVSPLHRMTAICLCKDGKCPKVSKACENNPCPDGLHCVPGENEHTHTCLCESGKKGNCSGTTALTLLENSFIKYRLPENLSKDELKLSLRLRTLSTHGTVMFAKGQHYSILEIVEGGLQYRFDCGSGQVAAVSVHSVQVNDGQWHAVWLSAQGNRAKLVLDHIHSASGVAPPAAAGTAAGGDGDSCSMHLRDAAIFLGGHAQLLNLAPRRRSAVPPSGAAANSGGLRGCLDGVLVNGRRLSLSTSPPSGDAVAVENMVGVLPGCGIFSDAEEGEGEGEGKDCSRNPCLNGGSCTLKRGGGYFCQCGPMFTGVHCETRHNPCASNPCLYGGTCIDNHNGFFCRCRGQYSGQRCQIGPYCVSSPCLNGGHCIESLDGAVCECHPGFRGDRCQSDVDECERTPCANSGRCVNTRGSFHCLCYGGFAGTLCEIPGEARHKLDTSSWSLGVEEILGMVLVLVSMFLFLLLFVGCWKAGCMHQGMKGRRRGEDDEDEDGHHHREARAFLQRSYPDPRKPNRVTFASATPQVPSRPVAYMASMPRVSRGIPDGHTRSVANATPEYFEPTFKQNPSSTIGQRKAVCSVAPHLPTHHSPMSVSDCDPFHKPNWNYQDDVEPFMKKRPRSRNSSSRGNNNNTSEVCSPGSPRSESSDDNGYHWDISDWVPSVQLHVQGLLHSDFVQPPPTGYIRPTSIDTDYLTTGLDIENDITPTRHYPPIDSQLPPVPRLPESYSPPTPLRRVIVPMSVERDSHSNAHSENAQHPVQRMQFAPPLPVGVPQSSVPGPPDFRAYGQDLSSRQGQYEGNDITLSLCSPALSFSDVSTIEEEDCDTMLSDTESLENGLSGPPTKFTC